MSEYINNKGKLMELEVLDWGVVPYDWAWKEQTRLFDELVAAKLQGRAYVNICLCIRWGAAAKLRICC